MLPSILRFPDAMGHYGCSLATAQDALDFLKAIFDVNEGELLSLSVYSHNLVAFGSSRTLGEADLPL